MKYSIYNFKFDVDPSVLQLPMMVVGFKRYYELNGRHSNDWKWIFPPPSYVGQSIDDIIDEAVKHNATVYAFSSYVWNWNVVKEVASIIKKRLPNSIVVLGGPHQGTTYSDPVFWFKKHPYFDAVCTPTEYGEWFITDLLDSISDGVIDWSSIRNSYHRHGRGTAPNKRTFEFPSDVVLSNIDQLLVYSNYAVEHNLKLQWLYEMSRGCPYGCTFCEWGGGINTKVISKPLNIIKDDISFIPILRIDDFYITDANLGILKEDLDKVNAVCDVFMITDKKFHVSIGGVAKTTIDKKKLILEPLLKNNITKSYHMSIQTVSERSLNWIDRTDISPDENVALAQEFISNYNAEVQAGFILGLPGSTLEDFYKEFDLIYKTHTSNSGVDRSPMLLLPDSPAADPEYISKYGIKLAPLGIQAEDGDVLYDKNYYVLQDKTFVKDPVAYIPIASLTYTVEDWKEMMFMADLDVLFRNYGKLNIIHTLMNNGILPSRYFPAIYKILQSIPEFSDPINQYLNDVVAGKYALRDWRKMLLNGQPVTVTTAYDYLWTKNEKEILDKLNENLLAQPTYSRKQLHD
jgi:radical SAM superfamily enzyme YgiQ (UPF0313 family)